MLIRLGYELIFDVPLGVPFVALLNVHPSRMPDLREPDDLRLGACPRIALFRHFCAASY